MYRVDKGTMGLVKKAGGKWFVYRAKKALEFTEAESSPEGDFVRFTREGWEFAVPFSKAVLVLAHGEERKTFGKFNRCILGKRGKGYNQRRRTRRRKG